MTLLWELLEVLLVAFGLGFAITQVFVPLFQGRPLYPIFRSKKEQRLKKELEEARQEVLEKDLKNRVDRTKSRI